MSSAQKARDYLQSKPGLQRLLEGLIEKYRSLGRCAGQVKLKQLSATEARDLQGFFGKPYLQGNDVSISFKAFEQELLNTPFADLSSVNLLESWLGEPLVSNAEARQQTQQRHRDLLHQMRAQFQDTRVDTLCQALEAGALPLRSARWQTHLSDVCKALSALPKAPLRIPIFAAQVSGDPHAFDLGKPLTSHFLAALKLLDTETEEDELSTTEQRTNLLERFNLIRDDIANFVTATGLLAHQNDQPHPVWQAAAQTHSVLNIPLREISSLTKVAPANGTKHVFVIENSTVFAAILDHFPATPLPLICSHGQFKLAFLRLVDLLTASDCQIAYASDFDPEGLLMAQRLCQRHPQVEIWRMGAEDYRNSGAETPISETRLRKLEHITHSALIETAKAVRESGHAGYQEAILPSLITDLEQHIKVAAKPPIE